MRLHMTDGKSTFEFIIDAKADAKEHRTVTKSKRPVSTALKVIKERVGAEVFSTLHPVPGVALSGIQA